jgi:fatty acid desaturase
MLPEGSVASLLAIEGGTCSDPIDVWDSAQTQAVPAGGPGHPQLFRLNRAWARPAPTVRSAIARSVTAAPLPSDPTRPVPGTADTPLLEAAELAWLNERRDAPGLRQLALHLVVLLAGGLLWGLPLWLPAAREAIPWPLRGVGLLLLGLGLAFAFCPMHESGHRTAFADRGLNDSVAWWAGVLSFYNADFYRRYHQWHHRYTHQPGLDPELEDDPPSSLGSYLLELSGIPWWLGKLRGHVRGLRGDFTDLPYIPPEASQAVARSIRLQAGVYGFLLLASLPAANGLFLWLWLLPLAVGQPVLLFVLLAEHGGCPFVPDSLLNTRTTLTLPPLRRLMWNMPYHAEHHLFPSLPFHSLAEAHRRLGPRLAHCAPGYLSVHRHFLADLDALAPPGTDPTRGGSARP